MSYRFSRPALVALNGPHEAADVCEALARAGYRAELRSGDDVRGGTEGYSFLVLDGGLEAVRALRRRGETIPVILLSGAAASTLPAGDVGGLERLFSPFTLDSLRSAIAKVSQNDRPGADAGPGIDGAINLIRPAGSN